MRLDNEYVRRYKRLKLRNSQGKCYFGNLRAGESDEDDNRRMSRGSLLREAYWRSFFSGGCSGRYVEWEDAGMRDSQEG